MTRDLMTTVDALRPRSTELDEDWSRDALASILATPLPQPARRKHRVGSVVGAALGVGLLGAGAATAAGWSPQSFTDAFSGWGIVSSESEPGTQAIDPATAERVATAAGPGRTLFTLVSAPGQDGFSCVAALFETRTSTAAPVPREFVDANGSYCAPAPPADARFGDMAAEDVQRQPGLLGEQDVRVFSISAGPAARAVARTSDGAPYEVVLFEGRFYGWFVGRGDDTGPTVLIGYAEDGTEVGRTRV